MVKYQILNISLFNNQRHKMYDAMNLLALISLKNERFVEFLLFSFTFLDLRTLRKYRFIENTIFYLHMSRLRACGPVIPGYLGLAGVDPARYVSGRYGDQIHYSDGILFLFAGGHTH